MSDDWMEEMRRWENEVERFEQCMKSLIADLDVDDEKETWDKKMSKAKEEVSSYWGKWAHIDKLLEFMSGDNRDVIIDALSKLCRVEPEHGFNEPRINEIVRIKRIYDRKVLENRDMGCVHRATYVELASKNRDEVIRDLKKRLNEKWDNKKGTNR